MAAHGVDRATAASLSSLLFLGWGLGAPFNGWLSDRLGRRKAPMLVSSVVATAAMASPSTTPCAFDSSSIRVAKTAGSLS